MLSMRSFGTQADEGYSYTVRSPAPDALCRVVPCGRLTAPPVQHYGGGKLASLRMDTPFKRAFASPETLSHFLNAVLNDDSEHRVIAVNNVEVKSTLSRSIIFDMHCTLANGSKVVIELQKANMRTQLIDRLVGYISNAYAQQWQRSGKTEAGTGYSLVPVRMVAVIDFPLANPLASPPEASGSLVANVSTHLRAGELPESTAARMRELLDITIMQLPLAPSSAERGAPAAQLWAHLLRHSEEYTVGTLPEALRAEPYASAAASARVDAMSAAERGALEVEENHVRDTARVAAERAEERARAAAELDAANRQRDELARQVAELTKQLRDAAGAGGTGG
jgi:PD-(D/E)XK nuclease family transposase